MDENYNVGMPVFSIHGNHDDPSGEQALCALDLLSAANFVNYFGQTPEPDDIEVTPICFKKGSWRNARRPLRVVAAKLLLTSASCFFSLFLLL